MREWHIDYSILAEADIDALYGYSGRDIDAMLS